MQGLTYIIESVQFSEHILGSCGEKRSRNRAPEIAGMARSQHHQWCRVSRSENNISAESLSCGEEEYVWKTGSRGLFVALL
jgi:hypothetical protein